MAAIHPSFNQNSHFSIVIYNIEVAKATVYAKNEHFLQKMAKNGLKVQKYHISTTANRMAVIHPSF